MFMTISGGLMVVVGVGGLVAMLLGLGEIEGSKIQPRDVVTGSLICLLVGGWIIFRQNQKQKGEENALPAMGGSLFLDADADFFFNDYFRSPCFYLPKPEDNGDVGSYDFRIEFWHDDSRRFRYLSIGFRAIGGYHARR